MTVKAARSLRMVSYAAGRSSATIGSPRSRTGRLPATPAYAGAQSADILPTRASGAMLARNTLTRIDVIAGAPSPGGHRWRASSIHFKKVALGPARRQVPLEGWTTSTINSVPMAVWPPAVSKPEAIRFRP